MATVTPSLNKPKQKNIMTFFGAKKAQDEKNPITPTVAFVTPSSNLNESNPEKENKTAPEIINLIGEKAEEPTLTLTEGNIAIHKITPPTNDENKKDDDKQLDDDTLDDRLSMSTSDAFESDIDRLISHPSPMVHLSNNTELNFLKEPELSSMYISPDSLTNQSVAILSTQGLIDSLGLNLDASLIETDKLLTTSSELNFQSPSRRIFPMLSENDDDVKPVNAPVIELDLTAAEPVVVPAKNSRKRKSTTPAPSTSSEPTAEKPKRTRNNTKKSTEVKASEAKVTEVKESEAKVVDISESTVTEAKANEAKTPEKPKSTIIELFASVNKEELELKDDKMEIAEPDILDTNTNNNNVDSVSKASKISRSSARKSTKSEVSTTASVAPSTTTSTIAKIAPEQQQKIDKFNEKITSFVNELILLEKAADLNDTSLNAEDMLPLVDSFLSDPNGLSLDLLLSESSKNKEANDSTPQEETEPQVSSKDISETQDTPSTEETSTLTTTTTPLTSSSIAFIRLNIIRVIQGQSTPLSVISTQVKARLTDLLTELQTRKTTTTTPSSLLLDELIQQINLKLATKDSLEDEIKSIANRECYGIRQKDSLMYEDQDIQAIWRWESISFQYFSKNISNLIREIRVWRKRYSNTIRSLSKAIEQLMKVPYDEKKYLVLEERYVKNQNELEKNKDRRREAEQKKLQDKVKKEEENKRKEEERLRKEEEKNKKEEELKKKRDEENKRKEEEKEKKRKEKEEQQQLKIQQQELQQQEKEKEKLKFKSFFASKSGSSLSSSSVLNNNTPSSQPTVIDLDGDMERQQKIVDIIKSASVPMSDIIRSNKERWANIIESRKRKRNSRSKYIKLSVLTSSSGQVSAFDSDDVLSASYSEIREITFRNKLITLSFHEDFRPAYVGTMSKKSSVISGRHPFKKDTQLLNYDYDSEEEWEEEEEGEDIMMSDAEKDSEDEEEGEGGEEGENADELCYDEFLRHDDDFGSDVGSDGEEFVAIPTFDRIKETFVGPRFITNAFYPVNANTDQPGPLTTIPTKAVGFYLDSEKGLVNSQTGKNTEDDVVCLSMYTPIVYSPAHLTLSINTSVPEKKVKKKKTTTEIPSPSPSVPLSEAPEATPETQTTEQPTVTTETPKDKTKDPNKPKRIRKKKEKTDVKPSETKEGEEKKDSNEANESKEVKENETKPENQETKPVVEGSETKIKKPTKPRTKKPKVETPENATEKVEGASSTTDKPVKKRAKKSPEVKPTTTTPKSTETTIVNQDPLLSLAETISTKNTSQTPEKPSEKTTETPSEGLPTSSEKPVQAPQKKKTILDSFFSVVAKRPSPQKENNSVTNVLSQSPQNIEPINIE